MSGIIILFVNKYTKSCVKTKIAEIFNTKLLSVNIFKDTKNTNNYNFAELENVPIFENFLLLHFKNI